MPTTLTKKGEATRQRIIAGAADVVRQKGAARSGLDDIRAITGTSGSQLMHYFPEGKRQLLLAVAAFEADQVMAEQCPGRNQLSTWESWDRWAEKLFAIYERDGAQCTLGALMGQLDPSEPEVTEVVATLFTRWEEMLSSGIRSLVQSGQARADLDPDESAAALVAAIQGGVFMILATGSTRYLRASVTTSIDALRLPR